MENTLNELLAKAVEKGLEIAEKSGQFVIDQAPELLQEFYRWHMISHSLVIFFSLVCLIALYKGFKMMGNSEKQNSIWKECKILGKWYEADHPGFIMPIIFMGFGGFVAILFMSTRIMFLIKILVAPKIYLIEYFIR